MKIKIKKINPEITVPKIESKNAVCMDVKVSEILQDGPFRTIKLGFSTEIPLNYKGCIVPRSSFSQKGWIMQNSPAQIDSDYRGEWMIKFEAIPIQTNVGEDTFFYEPFPYNIGDRCAQIYFEKVEQIEFEEVQELSETDRGVGGFGSTNLIDRMVEDVKTNRQDRKIN